MYKVKTFGEPLKPFQTAKEIEELDALVNAFIQETHAKVIAVSDTTTSEGGNTIGLIRTLVYTTD